MYVYITATRIGAASRIEAGGDGPASVQKATASTADATVPPPVSKPVEMAPASVQKATASTSLRPE
jgi:hypothetical protein